MQERIKPFFSVLTPAWNRADFLGTLINSLRDQTFQDFEWIIGNDGSTDRSHELLLERFDDLKIPKIYISSDIRIGKSKLDNLLLDNARGEYLIWCDADDFLKSNALETIFNIIKKKNISENPSLIGVIGQNLDTFGKSQTFNLNAEILNDNIYSYDELEKHLIGDGTICVKSSIFKNRRWPEVDFLITESILLRPLYRNKHFYLTNKVLKIMDRTAENSVSFGKVLQYCRGSAYSLGGTISFKQFDAMSLKQKIYTSINFFRYCSHGDISVSKAIEIWPVLKKNKFLLILYPASFLIILLDILRGKILKTHIEFESNKNLAEIVIRHFK